MFCIFNHSLCVESNLPLNPIVNAGWWVLIIRPPFNPILVLQEQKPICAGGACLSGGVRKGEWRMALIRLKLDSAEGVRLKFPGIGASCGDSSHRHDSYR